MLEQARGLLAQDYAIDLGTSAVRVYARGRGVVVEEASLVAIELEGTGTHVVAVGDRAKEMVGRTPSHIRVASPIQHGLIDDFELAETLLSSCFRDAVASRPRMRARTVVCVPASLSAVQRRALQESARAAGSREVMLLPTIIAAAYGAGIDFGTTTAQLIVDVGGGTTDLGVLAMGELLGTASITTAGQAFDSALADWVKERHAILLGESGAETLKLSLTDADDNALVQAKGRDLHTGIPREFPISVSEARGALHRSAAPLAEAVRQLLATLSPEVSADVLDTGLTLCGGAAPTRDLADTLAIQTGLDVTVAPTPSRCAVEGAGALLDHEPTLTRLVL